MGEASPASQISLVFTEEGGNKGLGCLGHHTVSIPPGLVLVCLHPGHMQNTWVAPFGSSPCRGSAQMSTYDFGT